MRWNTFRLDALCKLFQKRRNFFFPLAEKEGYVYSAFLVVRFYLILRFLKQLKQYIDTHSF